MWYILEKIYNAYICRRIWFPLNSLELICREMH